MIITIIMFLSSVAFSCLLFFFSRLLLLPCWRGASTDSHIICYVIRAILQNLFIRPFDPVFIILYWHHAFKCSTDWVCVFKEKKKKGFSNTDLYYFISLFISCPVALFSMLKIGVFSTYFPSFIKHKIVSPLCCHAHLRPDWGSHHSWGLRRIMCACEIDDMFVCLRLRVRREWVNTELVAFSCTVL